MFCDYVVTVDFETISPTETWFAYCVMLSKYPEGTILQCELGAYRPFGENPPNKFWRKNQTSYQYILKHMVNCDNGKKNIDDHEKNLCQTINTILQKYPHCTIISDNPSFDIKILDNLLLKHGFNVSSNRGHDIYYQCVCTWSFRISVCTLLRISNLKLYSFVKQYVNNITREVDGNLGPKHTPKADCARILSQYFQLLDIINFYRPRYHEPTICIK